MKINKFQFLTALALVQLFASSGFTRERPDRFAQDLGGNTICSPSNRADTSSRCPFRTEITPAEPQVHVTRSVDSVEKIPAPELDSERTPSSTN